ncbi:MAG: hypothetical protein DMF72_21145 [Acidobacteria bacterium]|nr:MAG: hypothetical protein DMF72_21145 [Acidobacteriota bacterium]
MNENKFSSSVRANPSNSEDLTYDFRALTQFKLVREMRERGMTIHQIEAELQGQMPLFVADSPKAERISSLTTNYDSLLQKLECSDLNVLVPDLNDSKIVTRLPLNAEFVFYLLLRKDERDVVIGDLIEDYGTVLKRFGKRRADIWLYKQVIGSVGPLIRRALLKIGALVWLGRILRRLVS